MSRHAGSPAATPAPRSGVTAAASCDCAGRRRLRRAPPTRQAGHRPPPRRVAGPPGDPSACRGLRPPGLGRRGHRHPTARSPRRPSAAAAPACRRQRRGRRCCWRCGLAAGQRRVHASHRTAATAPVVTTPDGRCAGAARPPTRVHPERPSVCVAVDAHSTSAATGSTRSSARATRSGPSPRPTCRTRPAPRRSRPLAPRSTRSTATVDRRRPRPRSTPASSSGCHASPSDRLSGAGMITAVRRASSRSASRCRSPSSRARSPSTWSRACDAAAGRRVVPMRRGTEARAWSAWARAVRPGRGRDRRRRPAGQPAAALDHAGGLRRPRAAPLLVARGRRRAARRRAGCSRCAPQVRSVHASLRRADDVVEVSVHVALRPALPGASPPGSSSATAAGVVHRAPASSRRAQPLTRAVRPVGPPGAPWHCLYFLPEPQGHSALRPTPANGRRRW